MSKDKMLVAYREFVEATDDLLELLKGKEPPAPEVLLTKLHREHTARAALTWIPERPGLRSNVDTLV